MHEALIVEYRDMAHWYDRFWADYLNKTLELPKQLIYEARTRHTREDLKIVDVGCGTGEFMKRLISSEAGYRDDQQGPHTPCTFCGVDASPEMLKQAKNKLLSNHGSSIKLLQGQAEALPLPDSSVDILCSTSAFHFFGNKRTALKEIYRVLKPQSSIVITDWCADYLIVRAYHFLEYLRWNVFHRYERPYPGPVKSHFLREMVEDAGFANIQIRTYSVRVFGVFYWGMQTVTASKS